MFIQTETTPNPETLKFLPGQTVLPNGTADFRDAEAANEASPLAASLFRLEGVTGVYLGGDFISVTKSPEKSWTVMKPLLLGAIMDHFVSNRPVMQESVSAAAPAAHNTSGDESEIVRQIIELLDTRIRPAVAQDGGDITFDSFDDGILYLNMRGACAGCPSSSATLKSGIENMMRHYVPEVVEVRAAVDTSHSH